MKKIIFLFVFIIVTQFAQAEAVWMHSFEEAKKMAIATNKLVLVDFWAHWCGPCKRMDSESWSKQEVQLLMDNFVPVKIDLDRNRDLARQYNVRGIPFIFIMDGNGKVLYENMGYQSKSQVINLLKKYALNTQFLQNELISYYKKKNFSSTLRLASKYQLYTLYLEQSIQSDFLIVSNSYFSEARKLLKKSDIKNKAAFAQKIDLLEIQEKLIYNKVTKANKMLEEYKKEDVDSLNIKLFTFLKYICCVLNNDNKQASFLEEKLTSYQKEKAVLFLKTS